MNKSIQNFRKEELKAIYKFIFKADDEEIANILNEIRVCHGLTVWDAHTKKLKAVQGIKLSEKMTLLVDEELKEVKDE